MQATYRTITSAALTAVSLLILGTACAVQPSEKPPVEAQVTPPTIYWDGDTAVYESGNWVLLVDYLNLGTRSEGQDGRLFQDGREVQSQTSNAPRETPFGSLKHWGSTRKRRWDITGWNFATRADVRTSMEFIGEANAPAAPANRGPHSYHYLSGDQLVTMTPSVRYVAIRDRGTGVAQLLASDAGSGLAHSPLNGNRALADNDLSLLTGNAATVARVLAHPEEPFALPVFEQGQALHIPVDELIVRFSDAPPDKAVRSRLAEYSSRSPVTGVTMHRAGSYTVQLVETKPGAVFAAARRFTRIKGVTSAAQFRHPGPAITEYDRSNRARVIVGYSKCSYPPCSRRLVTSFLTS